MGNVYLLLETDKYGQERHKIGMTKRDPQKRVKELSTGNSNVITILKNYETKNYKKIERLLHGKFATQKTESNNEWFTLTDEQVFGFDETCKKLDEMVNFMLENNPFYK